MGQIKAIINISLYFFKISYIKICSIEMCRHPIKWNLIKMIIHSYPLSDLAVLIAELQKFIYNTRYDTLSAGNDIKDVAQTTHSPNNEDNDCEDMKESVKEAIHNIHGHAHQLLLLIRIVPCLQEDEYPLLGQGLGRQQGSNTFF